MVWNYTTGNSWRHHIITESRLRQSTEETILVSIQYVFTSMNDITRRRGVPLTVKDLSSLGKCMCLYHRGKVFCHKADHSITKLIILRLLLLRNLKLSTPSLNFRTGASTGTLPSKWWKSYLIWSAKNNFSILQSLSTFSNSSCERLKEIRHYRYFEKFPLVSPWRWTPFHIGWHDSHCPTSWPSNFPETNYFSQEA